MEHYPFFLTTHIASRKNALQTGTGNAIIKRLDGKTLIEGKTREETTAAFLKDVLRDPLQALFMAPSHKERFAAPHSLADLG